MKIGSKRRRTKQQIEDEKLAALTKAAAIEDKLKSIDRLQAQLSDMKAQQQEDNEAERILSQMMDQGFVQRDENGQWGPGPNASLTDGQ